MNHDGTRMMILVARNASKGNEETEDVNFDETVKIRLNLTALLL